MSTRQAHLQGWVSFFAVVILALTTAEHALAQQKGAVAGTVTDSSGGVLKGAQVTVQSEGVVRSAVSNEEGLFFLNNLRPANYMVTVTYVGLSVFTKSVDIAAGQTANV